MFMRVFLVGLISLVSQAASAQELMDRLENRMGELSQRQAVISKNIANANTPGYIAQDVPISKTGAKPKRQRLGLVRTNGMHLGGRESEQSLRTINDEFAEKSPDGNQVDVVHETDKASRTSMDYDLTTSLYKQMTMMLKKAAGGQ